MRRAWHLARGPGAALGKEYADRGGAAHARRVARVRRALIVVSRRRARPRSEATGLLVKQGLRMLPVLEGVDMDPVSRLARGLAVTLAP